MCGAILEPIGDEAVLREGLLDGMPNADVAFVLASMVMVVEKDVVRSIPCGGC